MKIILTLVLTVIAVSSLAACNTTAGIGKDIEAAGKGIKNAAN